MFNSFWCYFFWQLNACIQWVQQKFILWRSYEKCKSKGSQNRTLTRTNSRMCKRGKLPRLGSLVNRCQNVSKILQTIGFSKTRAIIEFTLTETRFFEIWEYGTFWNMPFLEHQEIIIQRDYFDLSLHWVFVWLINISKMSILVFRLAINFNI